MIHSRTALDYATCDNGGALPLSCISCQGLLRAVPVAAKTLSQFDINIGSMTMHMKLLISATAISLVANLGSAYADEANPYSFDTVGTAKVEKLTEAQLDSVVGAGGTTNAVVLKHMLSAAALSCNGPACTGAPGLGGTHVELAPAVILKNDSP